MLCTHSVAQARKTKVDEDDEATFMKEHAARVHSTAKPRNISVVGRVGGGVEAGGGPSGLLSPTAPPLLSQPTPPVLFNPSVPPPPLMSITTSKPGEKMCLDDEA